MSISELIRELLSILIFVLRAASNQITISTTASIRLYSLTSTTHSLSVRLFSTAVMSAETILNELKQQLADENSDLKQYNLTNAMNTDSIKSIKNWYLCADQTFQEAACDIIIELVPMCGTSTATPKLNSEASHGTFLIPNVGLLTLAVILIHMLRLRSILS